MSNSDDQDTSVDNNEQKRDGSEAIPHKKEMDLQPREAMVQTQRDLELSPKRRSISGV